jgi:hypothetical protein
MFFTDFGKLCTRANPTIESYTARVVKIYNAPMAAWSSSIVYVMGREIGSSRGIG